MNITSNMDLNQLAERMGNTATQTEASAMRDLLVEAGHEGRDTSEVGEGVWIQMLERAVEIARAQDQEAVEEAHEFACGQVKAAAGKGRYAIFLPQEESIISAYSYACSGRYDTAEEAQAEADAYNRQFAGRNATVVEYSPELLEQRAKWEADGYYDWLDGKFRVDDDGLHICPTECDDDETYIYD